MDSRFQLRKAFQSFIETIFLPSPQRFVRFSLGSIFIYAGFSKLLDPKAFAKVLSQYDLIPEGLLAPVSIGLPALEFLAGLGLIFAIRGSLSIIFGLLITFVIVLWYGILNNLNILDTDVRHVWLGFTDLGGPARGGAIDAWGVGWTQAGIYLGPTNYPLENATVEQLDRLAWPDVDQLVRRDELRERAKVLKETTDFAVVGRACDSYGPLERCNSLRRMDQFIIDLGKNPEFAARLIDKVTSVLSRLLEIYLDTAGQYLDVIELPGDDYAAANPLISPRMFDRFLPTQPPQVNVHTANGRTPSFYRSLPEIPRQKAFFA